MRDQAMKGNLPGAVQQYPAVSPFNGLSDARPGWEKSHARSRIVAQGEGDLARWWSAVDAVCDLKNPAHSSNVIADYLKLALLWGSRRAELLKLRWEHVNFDGGYVLLPGATTKSGRDHIIPLTRHARAILVATNLSTTTMKPLPTCPAASGASSSSGILSLTAVMEPRMIGVMEPV